MNPVHHPKKGLPWWLVVLLVFGGLFLVGALAVGGFVWWLQSNKDRLAESGKKAMDLGRSFGATHDQRQCVDEGVRQLSTRSGFIGEAEARLFLKECVKHAQKTAGFCSGVPHRGDIMKTAVWAIGECERHGRAQDQSCGRLMQAIPEACEVEAR
jgi:hypothetical protein